MNATKSMAVVYEDAEARKKVVDFCDRLAKRFWGQFEFEVSWSSFDSLQDENAASEAAKKALDADFVVFGIRLGERIPQHLKQWVEIWLEHRGEHEGALVTVPSTKNLPEFEASPMSLYLRGVAHRAGMDYLTEVSQGLSHHIPESPESCAARAQQVTSLLTEILHFSSPRAQPPLS